ncbi:MAG TPA: AAA family ATPase [Polyangiaceae bacterium]|nr:AAA family ATPase [Polyangiaceae bacterium]
MSQAATHSSPSYSILENLVVSSRSVVQRARRECDGSTVVLKSFNQSESVPQQRRALEIELQILQALASPLILRAHEVCEVDGRLALVLEDFGGQALEVPRGGMDLAAGLGIARQAARALAHVHARGFVHNDVKPSNLLVKSETLELKLIDFHLASGAVRPGEAEGSEPQGSLPYMSPERSGRMNRKPDFRADYYSLGVTLFELFTGQLPFSANDALGWAHAHISKRPPLLSEVNPRVPRSLAELVLKLLAKDPEERYQSSHGLLWDLEFCAECWEKQRQIPTFSLGTRDVPNTLEICREIVGREAELERCNRVLAEALQSGPRLLLVSGSPGVGKSSLVSEFQRRAFAPQSYFLQSTFDRQERNRPYSALVRAFESLVAKLLTESEAKLAGLRERLLSTLGPNIAVMIDLVPQLSQITGSHPAVVELSPSETQHRLQRVIAQFIQVFADAEHPLVLAMDDCQWLDTATADTLFGLLSSADVRHLLTVLAFRDGEIEALHALRKLTERLQKESPQLVHELELEPLAGAGLTSLLAKTLQTTPADVAAFAELIGEKTAGNPFFVGELLSTLVREGILALDPNAGCWRWDLARTAGVLVSDNVGALMAERIGRLSPRTRAALSAAACLGNQFELAVLSFVLEVPEAELLKSLEQAVTERLLVVLAQSEADEAQGPRDEAYVFQHTRVQQAAYARLDEAERARLHRRIGQRLQSEALDDTSRSLFELLHHLNLGSAGIDDRAALVALAELNMRAVQRSLKTAAFSSAESYAQIALELLGDAGNGDERQLAFRAHYALAEAAVMLGDTRVEGSYERLFALAPDNLARANVHLLRTRMLENQGHLHEAVSEIRTALALFGVDFPESHAEIEQGIGGGIGKMQAHLTGIEVEELADLPTTDSAETAMVLALLSQVVPSAIQTYPPLFILAELMMFDLALTRGVAAVSCKNFVDCGILQASILNNHDVAYRLGRVAFELLERFAPTPLESSVNFVFGGFVSHWKAHFSEGTRAYETCQRRGLELGDMSHVAYAWAHQTQRSILTGRPLDDCQRELDDATSYLRRAHMPGQLVGTLPMARALARLRPGEADDEAIAKGDADATREVLESKNAQWAYSYGQCQTMVSFLLGDLAAARSWQAFTQPYSLAAASLFSVPDFHLFEALIHVRDFAPASEAERPALLAAIDRTLTKLETWGKASPANFEHKYQLLAAERARISGAPPHTVLSSYGRALKAAGEDFIHMRALINELEANFWLELDDPRHARPAFEAAYRLYAAWGATAKLRWMERKQPMWLRNGGLQDVPLVFATGTHTTSSRTSTLDASSILKATQSISKEVEPQKLYAALMATLIENAGAQNGCLVLQSELDQRYYVEARANVDDATGQALRAEALETAPGVCASAVRYVLRTCEPLALDDACTRGSFQADPYIVEHRVRSLLCVPILRQGELLGALYLENNQTSHAFTHERIEILQVLASQAAISICNAQLYAGLELRVRERTLELAQKTRQIASMLDNMDQGVFTVDEQLQVQPGYSRHLEQILGTSDIVGKNCMDLLFSGANLRPDALKAADAALRFSFGVEPWLARANSSHLIAEFSRATLAGEPRFFEVDWNLICDDLERVERLLVVVRDVTFVRKLKQAASEKAREADIVAQVLETGLDVFEEFCATALRLLEQNRATLASGVPLTPETMAADLRNLHTLKGNARLLSYTHLVDALHTAEWAYARSQQEELANVRHELLHEELSSVDRLIGQHRDVCARKLAPLAQSRNGRVERSLREISEIMASENQSSTIALERVRGALDRLEAVPLAELVKETSRIVPSLASELHLSVPVLTCVDAGLLLTPSWAAPVRDILVQCFKNALYHGLEAPEERARLGKSSEGRIFVHVERADDSLEISVSDDGRGLALDALRQKLGAWGQSDEALAERIFESGVSTAAEVGLVAGRGIGLDIVRSLLRARGGDVVVRFSGQAQHGHRACSFVIVLPTHAVLTGARGASPSYPPRAAE